MKNYRETIEGVSALLPELRMLGHASLRHARAPGLLPHRHEDAYEIFYLERGEVEWWVENEVVKLKANHVHVHKPGEKHGSLGPSLKPCSYYWFQIVFSKSKRLPGLDPRQAAACERGLARLRPRTFRGTVDLKKYFVGLFEECRAPREDSVVVARATLHLILSTLLRLGKKQLQPAPGAYRSFAIQRALRWIERNGTEHLRVSEWARAAGLSVSRFRERFLQEMGLSPGDYLRHQRIERARLLLQDSKLSVTDVAHETGFSSSQYFATVFKRMEGITPTHFARGWVKRAGR